MENTFTKSEIVEMILNIVAPESDYGKLSKIRNNVRIKLSILSNSELKHRFQSLTGMELIDNSGSFSILRKYNNFLNGVKINGLRQYCD